MDTIHACEHLLSFCNGLKSASITYLSQLLLSLFVLQHLEWGQLSKMIPVDFGDSIQNIR